MTIEKILILMKRMKIVRFIHVYCFTSEKFISSALVFVTLARFTSIEPMSWLDLITIQSWYSLHDKIQLRHVCRNDLKLWWDRLSSERPLQMMVMVLFGSIDSLLLTIRGFISCCYHHISLNLKIIMERFSFREKKRRHDHHLLDLIEDDVVTGRD